MEEEKGLIPTGREGLLDLHETYKVITRSEAMQDGVLPSVRRAYSLDYNTASREEDCEPGKTIKLTRKKSFGRKLGSPRANSHKMRSASTDFSIDIDQIINGGSGHVFSTVTNSELSFSFSGTTLPVPSFSSLMNHNNVAVNERSTSHKKDLDFVALNKMQIGSTMPIYLKFSDVRYKVKVKGRGPNDTEYILHGVTGSVDPGEVLALMGPSGGGKTTLLNLLSGRIDSKDHGGSITYNDRPNSRWLKGRIGFVLQDDVVFPHLTVRETLTYTALLRLPKILTKQQKQERAMNVISELGLERCQDTIIGGALVRGVSGGERKRVCIGNEILLDPSLLFLDEPTSGLDSTTALRIARMLHNIADAGKTVITTIHQPSSRLFNKFDKLILLGKGSSLYFGKASEAMLYFSSIGCSPLIAMNPAEFLIDLANGNINDKSIPSELKDKVSQDSLEIKHQDGWLSSMDIHEYLVGAYEIRVAHIEKMKLLKPVSIDSKWEMRGPISREAGASWWEQYCILFWRGIKERRHDYLSYVRITQVLSTAIIIGMLWWHSDSSSPKKLQDQAGLLFFISVFWGFFPVFTAIFTFPQERTMLAKERSVGMYKLSAYFIARNMSDLPLDLILPVLFLLIVYFMVGLKPVFTVFLKSMMTVFLCIIAAQGLGLAIGAALMDVKKATTLASIIIMTFMLAGGFFVQSVPFFISWIRYLSFNYHTYRLLLKIQYGCSNTSHSGFTPCMSTFVKELRLDDGGMEAGVMIAMAFGYRLLAYLFLRKMKI